MKGFRKLFSNDKKYYRKKFVLVVIKSDISDFIRGNFETKSQILAMRFALAKLLASFASYKIFSIVFI